MVRRKKYGKKIVLPILFISIIIALGIFAFSESVIGISNNLNYGDRWSNDDLQKGSYQTEATLNLPRDTSLFSFTPKYIIDTYNRNGDDLKVSVKYEIFNYNSNEYETIHTNEINLRNDYGEQNKYRIAGDSIYSTGVPEHIESIEVGKANYKRYYGCLPGMSISEAKELNPWIEGKSSYSYYCLYPGEEILSHEYDDDSDENWDKRYFAELITLNSNYIKEDKAKFKISVDILSSGIKKSQEDDFGIDLWDVETAVIDTYYYSESESVCEYQAKYTYQVSDSDYYTRNECNYQNSVIDCYKDSHCQCEGELVADCDSGICICEKETILDSIFPDTEEDDVIIEDIYPEGQEPVDGQVIEKTNYLSFIIPLIILTLLILIIRNIARKRK